MSFINLGPDSLDHKTRFLFDNIIDGVRDSSMLMWQAWDTVENKEVWILGRKVSPEKVMPVAILVESPAVAVKRYAPARGPGKDYDYSQVDSKIVRP
jgi:hypothetical protein